MELFKRHSDDISYIKYKESISEILNYDNFLHFTKRKITKLYDIETEKHFIRYKFELLSKWIKYNFTYTQSAVLTLEKILYIFSLKNFLNPLENYFVYFAHNIVFAKTRNIKSILVDIDLSKTDSVYYGYPESKCSLDDNVLAS